MLQQPTMSQAVKLGIAASTYLLGDLHDAYREWAEPAGKDAAFVGQMRHYELGTFSRDAGASITSLVERACDKFFAENDVQPASIDLVINFHSLHESVPVAPDTLVQLLRRRHGMSRAQGFSIAQQRCVSFLTILRLLPALMAGDPTLRRVLVVGADIVHQERYRNTDAIAMEGDGAVVALLERDCPHKQLLAAGVHTQGRYFQHMDTPADAASAQQYSLSSARTMQTLASRTLERAGLQASQLRAVLPHNGNLHFWRRFGRQFGLGEECLFSDNIGRSGHIYGCDALINLHDCLRQGRLNAGDHYLIGAIAFGRSYGCAVLRA
ncbi:3-oxoacyl-[acyl-carrier-protein] synthase III C-terminal domain-containing protein [Paucibacter sp. XJ19-41]|nr:3-oxoacyl-[acyl-carrier-protein] synthase III C-terminal domain-containing protein [Paucibacter sp. XJ19-41]